MLSYALNGVAGVQLFVGDLEAAASHLTEAASIVEATGTSTSPTPRSTSTRCGDGKPRPWRGSKRPSGPHTRVARGSSSRTPDRPPPPSTTASLATTRPWLPHRDAGFVPSSLGVAPDPARADRGGREDRLAGNSGATHSSGSPRRRRGNSRDGSGGGESPRTQALLSGGDEADVLYRDTIDCLGRSGVRTELARAHLLYGEWLRREKRRRDAHAQLRAAHDILPAMGMTGFAGRARHELLATGETVRKRTAESFDELTPQEARFARLAATVTRTRRSARSSSSARAPSSGTCARSSPSSVSRRDESSGSR